MPKSLPYPVVGLFLQQDYSLRQPNVFKDGKVAQGISSTHKYEEDLSSNLPLDNAIFSIIFAACKFKNCKKKLNKKIRLSSSERLEPAPSDSCTTN